MSQTWPDIARCAVSINLDLVSGKQGWKWAEAVNTVQYEIEALYLFNHKVIVHSWILSGISLPATLYATVKLNLPRVNVDA